MVDIKTKKRGVRKERRGVVVSKSGSKSIVVLVESRKQHPRYGKTIRQLKKLHVHDEQDQAGVGDIVRVVETRPMSRLKRWRLVEVFEKKGIEGDSKG